jgi:acetyltransferase
MAQHRLNCVFAPKSVAVFGASDTLDKVGKVVFENMLQSGFQGALYAINPKYSAVQGCKSYFSISHISEPIELAVIATPAHTIPAIIKECGDHGVKAAIIISAGFSELGNEGKALELKVLDQAKKYRIRLVGPNCLGVMRPYIGLNATFNKGSAIPGNLSFVSQSGAYVQRYLIGLKLMGWDSQA